MTLYGFSIIKFNITSMTWQQTEARSGYPLVLLFYCLNNICLSFINHYRIESNNLHLREEVVTNYPIKLCIIYIL